MCVESNCQSDAYVYLHKVKCHDTFNLFVLPNNRTIALKGFTNGKRQHPLFLGVKDEIDVLND